MANTLITRIPTHDHDCAVCGDPVIIACWYVHTPPLVVYCPEHQPPTPQRIVVAKRRVAA